MALGGVYRLGCRQGCQLTTLESMVLQSVDQGCGAGWDGASCSSRAVSTGHGAGSGVGLSSSVVVGDAQAAVRAGDAGVRSP
ncbi:hypothetical protein NDU88_006482 [Pleurodeles waltl]|uniref:Uncharacterized protein n=1 Tax=Pleurodeles waltl TaxID=8319 RepID=A0AAV7N134_PLEWA|nr:hypothetical protein NDU88_006482 [Pleurodeles waltl]